ILGGLGALLFVDCGEDAETAVSPDAPTGGTPDAPTSSTATCVLDPNVTKGPYWVDEKLDRADVRGDRPGLPLALAITVYAYDGGTCTPLDGAQVDIWHCDATGLYSDTAANGTVGQNFLRGYQVTDAAGVASFTTIYPGWYSGRTVHIHVK